MPRLPPEIQSYIATYNVEHRPRWKQVLTEFLSKVPALCGNTYCRRRVTQEYYDGIFFGKRFFFGERTGKQFAWCSPTCQLHHHPSEEVEDYERALMFYINRTHWHLFGEVYQEFGML